MLQESRAPGIPEGEGAHEFYWKSCTVVRGRRPVRFELFRVRCLGAESWNRRIEMPDEQSAGGFRVAEAGRGNWPHGPRIVAITLTRKLCECQVRRLYYSPGAPGIPGVHKDQKELRILETIACRERAKK